MATDETRPAPAASWPAASLKEIEARLCAPGQRFEMETVEVRGIPTRTWKNLPRSLAAFARFAGSHGERPFLILDDERVSYESWFRATALLAVHLQSLGVRKGDRVALAMRNLPEWPVAFFAATCIGAILVPLNAWGTELELKYALTDSGASVVVCDQERLTRISAILTELSALEHILVVRGTDVSDAFTRLEDIIGAVKAYSTLPDAALPAVEINPEDHATIFYTSGTTGAPKGALGTHRNILSCVMAGAYVGQRNILRRGETPEPPKPRTILTVVPFFHVTGCNSTLMGAIGSGATLVLMHKWDASKALALIEREKVNVTGGVPTIAWDLLEHPDRKEYDLSSLDAVSYGGAPSPPELVRRLRSELNVIPSSGWGMTETSATVTSHGAEDYINRPDSCGPPLPVSDLKIVGEDGKELPVGAVGELWARGPQIVKGYWNNPEATTATFIDGWVRTGDLARLDEEGFCYIVDRAKDIIIRGGENIYSVEVENALYDHPAIAEAALIGIPHRTLGEIPVAVVAVVRGAQVTEAELQFWVLSRLASFKVPTRILIRTESLPRNVNGKILKRELRSLFGDQQAP